MVQMAVTPRRSIPPSSDSTRMTLFTMRYGPSFLRNRTTGGASQRATSTGVGPDVAGARTGAVGNPPPAAGSTPVLAV
jgi:hypothetical protein